MKKLMLTVLLVGVVGTGLVGCAGSKKESSDTSDQQHIVVNSTVAELAKRIGARLQPLTSGTPPVQPVLAPFFGNLSALFVPSGDVALLQRQADCSLTFSDVTFSASTTSLSATFNSQTPDYEKTLHNNAFLSTTPDLFQTGCVDARAGITSGLFDYLGLGKNGQNLGAATDSASVFTAGQKSDGTFTTPTSQTTPQLSASIVSGDLDKDGNQDVVSINSDAFTSSVTVFLGNADGSYQSGVTYPLPGANAQYGVLDDLNGDGILDLLVSSDSPTFTFSIFIGNGDGTFKLPAQTFTPTGTFNTAFITADVNNDNVKDIVTAQGQVFLGQTDGTNVTYTLVPQPAFPPIGTATNQYAPSIVAADFNKDGKVDLATNDGATIRTYQGNGDGTFTTGPAYATISNRGFLVATDLDGDGNIDLFTGLGGNGWYGGDDYETNTAYALMGNGDGTFQGAPTLPATYTGTNLADLNHDGHADLVGLRSNGTSAVFTTSLGQSNGTFVAGPELVAPPYVSGLSTYQIFVDSYAVADFNGDKFPDLIYLPSTPLPVAGYFLAIGNGDGSFQTPTFIAAPSLEAPANDINEVLSGIMVADFNHDGNPDIIYSFTDTSSVSPFLVTEGFVVQFGNADGTFGSPHITTTYSSPTAPTFAFSNLIAAVADVNKDNFPDVFLVLPTTIVDGTAQHEVELFIANGDGTFEPPTTLALTGNINAPSSSGFGIPITVADLTKNGNMDLVVGGSSADGTTPELAVALGNGDGSFQPSAILQFQGFGPLGSPAVADFDGDGIPDVFVSNGISGDGILPGVGDGTFKTISVSGGTYVAPPDIIVLAASGNAVGMDLNGDTLPDLIVGNVVLLNKKGAVVTPPTLAPTTTGLTSSVNPAVVGQTVTLTATVTSGTAGTITGTVTFINGMATLGTGSVGVGGVATLQTSALLLGSHGITAVYGGDTNYSGSSTSVPALTEMVNQASTSTVVISSANPSVTGQPVTFTATVSALAPGAGTPTGNVTFLDGATQIGTRALAAGVAMLQTSTLSVAPHSITATYAGDANFLTSTSSPALPQVVNKAATLTMVISSANPSVTGQPVTFTATVSAIAPGAGTPTGNVTFLDGATQIGTRTLAAGVATLPTSTLSVGPHSITAIYADDANFLISTSSPALPQTVNKAATTTAVLSSLNPSTSGQAVTFTATVSVTPPGAGAPTGSVNFFDGASNIGNGALAAGVATLPTSTLSVGPHSITATYAGDANFLTSPSSPALTQNVNAAGAPSFTVSAPSVGSLQVVAGQNATPFTFTVMPNNGSTQTVSFACTGLPALASCMFQPTSVTLDGVHASSPVSVTITTTSDGLAGSARRLLPPAGWMGLQRTLEFASLAMCLIIFRLRSRGMAWMMGAAVLLVVLTSITGCGAYKTSTTYSGTPPGTYAVTVTGASGGMTQPATSPVSLTVTLR